MEQMLEKLLAPRSMISGMAAGFLVGELCAALHRRKERRYDHAAIATAGAFGAVFGTTWFVYAPFLGAHLLIRALCKLLFRQ